MPFYEFEVPLLGYYWCRVHAENEEEAKSTALKVFGSANNIDESTDNYELIELNGVSAVVEGNVFHGSLDRIQLLSTKATPHD